MLQVRDVEECRYGVLEARFRNADVQTWMLWWMAIDYYSMEWWGPYIPRLE